MQNYFGLALYADDLMRERRAEATHEALIAQLPHSPAPRPDLAARLRVAQGLRALAVRLDPCAAQQSPLATATSR